MNIMRFIVRTFLLTLYLTAPQFGFCKENNQACSAFARIELAKILGESEDLPSSYTVYNQTIQLKEKNNCFDPEYVQALYGAFTIASAHDPLNAQIIFAKLQEHDREHCPAIRFENGYFIMENLPQCMCDKENTSWIKEILRLFGMSVSDDDIV